jgi:ribokinase
MAGTVTVVGSINVDLVARVRTLPRPGETVLGGELVRSPGGKGANQALAAARLGADVLMVGAVGDDEDAAAALANLAADGVDLTRVRVGDRPTGVAMILVAEDGENQIVVLPGANGDVRPLPEDLRGDAVLCQAEINDEALVAVAAGTTGLLVVNAAPARDLPTQVWERADVVIVNAEERRAVPPLPDRTLLVVTRGRDGATAHRAGVQVGDAAAPAVTAVDTVGAGDTFCAALTVAMVAGLPLDESLARACAAAAFTVSHPGAQAGMPRTTDLETGSTT